MLALGARALDEHFQPLADQPPILLAVDPLLYRHDFTPAPLDRFRCHLVRHLKCRGPLFVRVLKTSHPLEALRPHEFLQKLEVLLRLAGKPDETEEDFELLKEFVRTQRFERMGCFQYSDEEGTAAFEMSGKVPGRTIERRWREVMAIQKRINREQNRERIGKSIEVLVEGASPETEHLLVGRHQGQAPEVDGQVYINEGMAYPGDCVTVEVTDAHDYDLVGRITARNTLRRTPRTAREAPRAAVWVAPR